MYVEITQYAYAYTTLSQCYSIEYCHLIISKSSHLFPPFFNLCAVYAGGTDQEVEIQMYDADNLSSPPSSRGSDTDLTSYDPLLDFSRDDGFDHQPGVKSAGAQMNSSVQKMQREISVST